MSSLILHPTTVGLWHTLLHDAQRISCIQLHRDLECYLIFLLMRFMTQPAIVHAVLGLEFLEGVSPASFREVGDKCLLFAGLFPECAQRRRVQLSYFIKLGRAAYIASGHHHNTALFTRLANDFPLMMDVLQATRNAPTAVNLLQAFELWHETKSLRAWKQLCDATESLITAIESPSKHKH